MLGSRQLGSFELAGGTVAPPAPVGPGVWIETDAIVVTPSAADAELAFRDTDVSVVPIEADAVVIAADTDATVYL
jgi:hypothetical protein